jgi:hypothetical protein
MSASSYRPHLIATLLLRNEVAHAKTSLQAVIALIYLPKRSTFICAANK